MQTLRLSEKTCAFLRVTKSSTEQRRLLPCRRHRLILYIALQEQLLAVSVDCRLGTRPQPFATAPNTEKARGFLQGKSSPRELFRRAGYLIFGRPVQGCLCFAAFFCKSFVKSPRRQNSPCIGLRNRDPITVVEFLCNPWPTRQCKT